MKNMKLRMVWLIPNIFLYIMFLATMIWTTTNAQDLREINKLSMYIVLQIVILIVALLGSYRIWGWIKGEKL